VGVFNVRGTGWDIWLISNDFNIPKQSKIRVGEHNSMGISIDPNHQHNMIEIVHPNKIH
jgi:hypothetical protein